MDSPNLEKGKQKTPSKNNYIKEQKTVKKINRGIEVISKAFCSLKRVGFKIFIARQKKR